MNARFVAPIYIHAHQVPEWEVNAFQIRFFGFDKAPTRHAVTRAIAAHTDLNPSAYVHLSLSNGGMYMVPVLDRGKVVVWRDGDRVQTCSAAAAGIRASLIALREILRDTGEHEFGKNMLRLEDYAQQHPERRFILGSRT
jgi:hypothetical protein